jgi:hypothetical protein
MLLVTVEVSGYRPVYRVTAYDNGMIAVDGVPINEAPAYDPGTAGWAQQRQCC